MSVRKRTWKNPTGEAKEAWIVDYVDQQGKRHIETYARKKDADERHAAIKVDVSKGIHTPSSRSLTVAQAANDWLNFVEIEEGERSTLALYRQVVEHHINPRIGGEKLAKLTTPRINAFRDELLQTCSRRLAKRVLSYLKSILRDARRRGNVAQNVADGVTITANKRSKKRLEIGIDIPTPLEISKILAAAAPGWKRALLVTAVFTGLRSSELRGLRWTDIDLAKGEVTVRQRADRYNTMGPPKSQSSARTIPVGPFVVNTLREWKLKCPGRDTGERDADGNVIKEQQFVFPTRTGRIASRSNIIIAVLWPTLIAASVTVPVLGANGKPEVDDRGKPTVKAKYTGLHALRHFYASWCINRKVDGGLELPAKMVQERLGHANIAMTLDTYGHLFPRGDDGRELAEAELRLIG
jgi:integrase